MNSGGCRDVITTGLAIIKTMIHNRFHTVLWTALPPSTLPISSGTSSLAKCRPRRMTQDGILTVLVPGTLVLSASARRAYRRVLSILTESLAATHVQHRLWPLSKSTPRPVVRSGAYLRAIGDTSVSPATPPQFHRMCSTQHTTRRRQWWSSRIKNRAPPCPYPAPSAKIESTCLYRMA